MATFNFTSPDALAQEAGKLDYGSLPATSRLRGNLSAHIATIPTFDPVIEANTYKLDMGEVPQGAWFIGNLASPFSSEWQLENEGDPQIIITYSLKNGDGSGSDNPIAIYNVSATDRVEMTYSGVFQVPTKGWHLYVTIASSAANEFDVYPTHLAFPYQVP